MPMELSWIGGILIAALSTLIYALVSVEKTAGTRHSR